MIGDHKISSDVIIIDISEKKNLTVEMTRKIVRTCIMQIPEKNILYRLTYQNLICRALSIKLTLS